MQESSCFYQPHEDSNDGLCGGFALHCRHSVSQLMEIVNYNVWEGEHAVIKEIIQVEKRFVKKSHVRSGLKSKCQIQFCVAFIF